MKNYADGFAVGIALLPGETRSCHVAEICLRQSRRHRFIYAYGFDVGIALPPGVPRVATWQRYADGFAVGIHLPRGIA